MERAVGLSYIDMIESAYSMSVSPGRMLKKAVLLSRPALARRDAPFPNKAAGGARTGSIPSGAHGATNKEHHVCARRRDVRRPGPC